MALLDRISDAFTKLVPAKTPKPSTSMSGGIGNSHGMGAFEDDVSVLTVYSGVMGIVWLRQRSLLPQPSLLRNLAMLFFLPPAWQIIPPS